jgi:predicted metal-dependent phosphoesterase TrpH
MLIDLHTHTRPLSWDSFLTPDDLVEQSRKAGLDGVCLSEHDFFWDLEKAHELSKRHNFLVLPAIELNTEDGHMLCYGLEKYVYGMHRIHELAGHIDRANAAMIAAHPYRRILPWDVKDDSEFEDALGRARRNPAFQYCAGLERINGRGSAIENEFSARLCDLLEMPGTAGSDAHAFSDVGKCATEFDAKIETLADLIGELKAGRFRPVDLVKKPAASAPQV